MKKDLFKPFSFSHITPLCVFVLLAVTSQAQVRAFNAKKGDEFKRYIITRSNCVLERGAVKLNLSSYSEITKSYTVTAAANDKFDITVTVNRVVDSTNANGEHIVFDSGKKSTDGSNFQHVFADFMGQPTNVSMGADGKVISVGTQTSPDEASLAFVGISNEHYQPGRLLEIALDFPLNSSLKTGDSWTDSTAATVTKFTVFAINGRFTTVTYTSADKAVTLNSNANGSMLVDNQSGLILKRATQSVTVGYEVVRGVVYTAIRRTSTAEACVKD